MPHVACPALQCCPSPLTPTRRVPPASRSAVSALPATGVPVAVAVDTTRAAASQAVVQSASPHRRRSPPRHRIKTSARNRMQHEVADKRVYCHETLHYHKKLQSAFCAAQIGLQLGNICSDNTLIVTAMTTKML